MEALVYLLESAVAVSLAVVAIHEGKRGLLYAWAAAAAGFLLAAAVRLRRGRLRA